MNLRIINCIIALSFICSLNLEAQDPLDSVPVVGNAHDIRVKSAIQNTHLIGEEGSNRRDSLTRLLEMFYFDQFRHYQDPRAPYFMFMSKNGDLALGVGGQIKIKGYFDWNGSIPSLNFAPYNIPIPKDLANMHDLAATPQGTGLFFTLLGNHSRFGKYMAYFQADFSGYNHRDFRIKKAYITIGDWTAGYTTTTFEDTKAEPSTVDGAGPNGINSKKSVLLRYMHTWKKHWSLAASLEFPSQSIEVDNKFTSASNPYIPDLAAFGQYQWDDGHSHVRLSGLLRTLSYRDLVHQKNSNITGWALQLSSVLNPISSLDIYAIASFGKGHASYTTDLGNGNFDLIPKGDTGNLYAPLSSGFVLGLQYFFTPKLYSNLAYSQQIYYPKKEYLQGEGSTYRYGLYAVGNIFWSLTPRFEVGAEYLYGLRRNQDGTHGSADRFMLQMMLSF